MIFATLLLFLAPPVPQLRYRLTEAGEPGQVGKVHYVDVYLGQSGLRLDYGGELSKIIPAEGAVMLLLDHVGKQHWSEPLAAESLPRMVFSQLPQARSVLGRPCVVFSGSLEEEGVILELQLALLDDGTLRQSRLLEDLTGLDLATADFSGAKPRGVPGYFAVQLAGESEPALLLELIEWKEVEKTVDFFQVPASYQVRTP
jgi:hypothetical protein